MECMAESELTTEIGYFESHRSEWLKHYEGKFALIKGQDAHGFYDSWELAYDAGIEEFGVVSFLVKQVLREDRTEQAPALVYGLINPHLE